MLHELEEYSVIPTSITRSKETKETKEISV